MTTIRVQGSNGYSDWGRKTPEEMIAIYKAHARQQFAEAKAILDARNDDFHVVTHTGVHIWRNVEVIQEGKPND